MHMDLKFVCKCVMLKITTLSTARKRGKSRKRVLDNYPWPVWSSVECGRGWMEPSMELQLEFLWFNLKHPLATELSLCLNHSPPNLFHIQGTIHPFPRRQDEVWGVWKRSFLPLLTRFVQATGQELIFFKKSLKPGLMEAPQAVQQPGEEKAPGRPCRTFQYLKEQWESWRRTWAKGLEG